MKRFLASLLGTTPTTAEILKLTVGTPVTFMGAIITPDVLPSLLLLACSLAFLADAGTSLGKRIEE